MSVRRLEPFQPHAHLLAKNTVNPYSLILERHCQGVLFTLTIQVFGNRRALPTLIKFVCSSHSACNAAELYMLPYGLGSFGVRHPGCVPSHSLCTPSHIPGGVQSRKCLTLCKHCSSITEASLGYSTLFPAQI